MPTRILAPSCLAHSCSRVYRRSPGTLDIGQPFLTREGWKGVFTTRAVLAWPRISTPTSVPIAACALATYAMAMERSTEGPYVPDVTMPIGAPSVTTG